MPVANERCDVFLLLGDPLTSYGRDGGRNEGRRNQVDSRVYDEVRRSANMIALSYCAELDTVDLGPRIRDLRAF